MNSATSCVMLTILLVGVSCHRGYYNTPEASGTVLGFANKHRAVSAAQMDRMLFVLVIALALVGVPCQASRFYPIHNKNVATGSGFTLAEPGNTVAALSGHVRGYGTVAQSARANSDYYGQRTDVKQFVDTRRPHGVGYQPIGRYHSNSPYHQLNRPYRAVNKYQPLNTYGSYH